MHRGKKDHLYWRTEGDRGYRDTVKPAKGDQGRITVPVWLESRNWRKETWQMSQLRREPGSPSPIWVSYIKQHTREKPYYTSTEEGRAKPRTIVMFWSKCLFCSSQVRSHFQGCFLFLKKISCFYFYHVSLIQCFVPGHKNPETLVGTLPTQIHACNIC